MIITNYFGQNDISVSLVVQFNLSPISLHLIFSNAPLGVFTMELKFCAVSDRAILLSWFTFLFPNTECISSSFLVVISISYLGFSLLFFDTRAHMPPKTFYRLLRPSIHRIYLSSFFFWFFFVKKNMVRFQNIKIGKNISRSFFTC